MGMNVGRDDAGPAGHAGHREGWVSDSKQKEVLLELSLGRGNMPVA